MRLRLIVPAVAGIGIVVGGWMATGRARRVAEPLQAAIAGVETGRLATPLVGTPGADGYATVTFLAKREGGRPPRIVSDVTGWGEHIDGTFDFSVGTMARVGDTDWYSLQARVAPGARIEYLISYGLTDFRLDPHNPRQSAGPQVGGAKASEFVTGGYVPPQAWIDPPVSPAGLLTETALRSVACGMPRRVIVYTPPGYRPSGEYAFALFLDARAAQISRVIDWLIAREAIEPIVAAFEGPTEMGIAEPDRIRMLRYVTGELPAWVAARYAITRNAERRAVLAISFGARDALDAAICPASTFGRLGLLIPGRRIGREDVAAISRPRSRRLRVVILAGQYDHANRPTAEAVRRELTAAGDGVEYIQVAEGHTASTWANHLGAVLVALFSASRPPPPPA